MTHDTLPALLTSEGADLTDPEQVERALAVLWKPPAAFGASDPAQTATRVCAANLVVVAAEQDWTRVGQVLGELSPNYPTRTIVWLVRDPTRRVRPAYGQSASVRAWVFALCHVPQPGRPQVCCEQIVLRGSTGAGHDRKRTLLPLLESDVPMVTWWTLPPGSEQRWYTSLCELSDRLVVDAGPAGLAHLRPVARCAVREVGWYRTTHWRHWLAGLFDTAGSAALDAIEKLRVRVGGDEMRAQVDALWIAAFLAGQLGWRPARRESGTMILESHGRPIRVQVVNAPDAAAGIEAVTLVAGPRHYEIARCSRTRVAYRIAEHTGQLCRLPRSTEAPRTDLADALVTAFTGRPADHAFDRAAPIAAWMAGP